VADGGLPITRLLESSATLGDAASALAPVAGLLERIYYDDLSIAVDDSGASVWLSLALDGQVGFDLPGGFAIQLGVGDGVTSLTLGLRIGEAGVALAVEDLAVVLAIPAALLRPAPAEAGGSVADHVELVVRGGLVLDEQRRLVVEGFDSVSLPRSFVGASQIVVSASDVAIDTSRGLILGEARVELPEGLPQLAPEELVLDDAVIGSSGVSGRLAALYTPVFDPATKQFTGRGAGELGGVAFGLTALTIELRDNDLIEGSLAGLLLLPFFELPTAVTIALRADGAFSIELGGGTPLISVERAGLLRLAISHLGFEIAGGALRVHTGGTITMLVGGAAWPSFRADDVVLSANGDLAVHGLGMTLTDGKPLDLGKAPTGAGKTPGVTIDKLDVSGSPLAEGLVVDGQLSALISLGPVTASVQGLGAHARLIADVAGGRASAHDLAFHPPLRIALAVQHDLVSGGGFIDRDPSNDKYAGGLEFKIKQIGVAALALLEKRDGSWSMFAVLAARFPGIPIGFGLFLDGVGGVIGTGRRADIDRLRAGLRDHTLDGILFPSDIGTHGLEMLERIGAAFPAAPGRVVVGPMAKIGWGTPRMIAGAVALLLELPAPVRLVLLAQLRLGLPTLDKPVVDLRLDALGVLDLERRTLALDASLHDSTIAGYALTGDMALRLGWGDAPELLLAIGGFHPHFTPPASFPPLRRLALTAGDNPQLRLSAYLALTSNTAQVGGQADLTASGGGFSIRGHIGFDALFEFAPFHFEVEITASAAIAWHGHKLAGVDLDFLLTGPHPWHAKGHATFGILWWDVSVGFDTTWGDATPAPLPPPPAVGGALTEALRRPEAWSSELTAGEPPWITLATTASAGVAVHPFAEVVVRERAVPLGYPITQFGNVPVAAQRFDIVGVRVGSTGVASTPVTDAFAPGQFTRLTADQRLAAPSFEQLGSGVRFARDEVRLGASARSSMDLDTEVVDPLAPVARPAGTAVPSGIVVLGPAVRPTRPRRPPPRTGPKLADLAYVLASVDDLSITAEGAALAAGDRSYAGLREALAARTAAARRRHRLQIVPRVQVSNHHAHVVVVREDDNLRNLDFVDTLTGRAMTRAEFVEAIRAGEYPDYYVRAIHGVQTPVSRPNATPDDNLG
jgi:hypothetical protein